MANITFTGNIYFEDLTIASDISYKLYFKKNNTGSSPSKWSDIRHTEPGLHQYNINLGDSDLLTNSGVANIGDEIILLYWDSLILDNTSLLLNQWSAIHYTLTSDQIYVQNVRLSSHKQPICDFTFNTASVNNQSSIIDIGSNDDYDFIFEGKPHFQKYQYIGQNLFEINKIPDSSVDIDWGDGLSESGLNLSDSPFPHIYTSTGEYTSNITLYNSDLLNCNQSFIEKIVNNIVTGLSWNTPVYLNVVNTYTPNITGDTSSILGVDYYIDGNLLYPNLDYDQSFDHTFSISGDHEIKQCIRYNDGFDVLTECRDFTVILGSIAHFYENDFECGLVFTSDSQIGSPPVITYQWDVTHNNTVLAHVEGDQYDKWYYTFPYPGIFQVRLQVRDQNNVVSYEKEYVIEECSSGSGGNDGLGGSAPWIYNEYKEEITPKITILDIDIDDLKNKKILILEVIE